jgi:hypothetical protein
MANVYNAQLYINWQSVHVSHYVQLDGILILFLPNANNVLTFHVINALAQTQ